jgi:uridylate kinase
MVTAVISIGGSLLFQQVREDAQANIIKLDIELLERLSKLLEELSHSHQLYIVVGGGTLARSYIETARKLNGNEALLDQIGISATKLNALMLIASLSDKTKRPRCVYPKVAETYTEAMLAGKSYPLVVMGGTEPAHTTDAVAAVLAELVGADRLINATAIDGVYTADPIKVRDAKRIPKLTFEELIDIVASSKLDAGSNVVIDPVGAKIIARSRIPTMVLYGRDIVALRNAIEGKKFHGTVIL